MAPARGWLALVALLGWAAQAAAAEEGADDAWADDAWGVQAAAAPLWHGFVEGAAGARLRDDPARSDDSYTLAELRTRLEYADYLNDSRYSLKADLWADGVEHGLQGDLREALLDTRLGERIDLRLGQQVLTWGTGDLLFLNDLFAKDWTSFFAGRQDEYLKTPTAAVKLSAYGEGANLDLVWTPRFRSDRFIDGERFSYFDAASGQATAARLSPRDNDEDEWAARLYRTVAGTEWALYGYHGYWKQPNAVDSQGQPFFSRLDVLGASVRGNLAGGIGNLELAWYEGEDGRGDDPRLPNDQLRWLAGYERELRPRLNLGLQYYLEWTQDYEQLKSGDGGSPLRRDEFRHLLTLRLTQRLWQDNLTLSWFSFWSPSERDWYLRPTLHYRFDDRLSLSAGANLFGGREAHSFFGQFEDASSLYLRLRYSF